MRPCWLVVTSCPQTSNTFPSMCRASLETAICNLETIALVQTADLHGNLQVGRETALVQCGCTDMLQESGGDQVTAEVVTDTGAVIETSVVGR